MSWRWVFAVPAVMAGCYYGLALVAALRRGKDSGAPVRQATERRSPAVQEPVSVLKPVYRWDDRLVQAIASHAQQDYPEFELLLGIRDGDTHGMGEISGAFPMVRMVPVTTAMPNGKVGSLCDLAAAAKYPILVINDADICVEPDYLQKVTEALNDARTGLVTALYRATACSFPARFEALGVATEFAPSVLVARLLGVAEFALGSTMAIRAVDLERIGGFRAIGDYLADDYQLGARITRLGLRVAFADTVVETSLDGGRGAGSWGDVWRHQVRWSRTIRVSRPSGYYGYVVTQATFWACVAGAAGYWQIAAATLAVRIGAGAAVAGTVLKDRVSLAHWWMMPLRDLFGLAVWLAAAFGHTVEWRSLQLRLTPDGRIHASGKHPGAVSNK